MEEEQPITGFIHKVSPIKKSGKKSYFELSFQTEETVIRGVHFKAEKLSEVKELSERKQPCKLSKYRKETRWNVPNILINEESKIEPIDNVAFKPIDLPQNLNVASLSSLAVGQLVTIKGQIVQITPVKKIKTSYGAKSKAEAFVLDPSGCIKITLWENFATQCEEEMTYTFENVRLQKDFKSQVLCLNTAKTGSSIWPCDPFEEVLVLPSTLPDTFTANGSRGKVFGVNDYGTYLSCLSFVGKSAV